MWRGETVRILCNNCNQPIKLQKAIDTKKFDGEVVCQSCNYVWRLKLVDSKIQGYRLKGPGMVQPSPDERMSAVLEVRQRANELLAPYRQPDSPASDNVPESGTQSFQP